MSSQIRAFAVPAYASALLIATIPLFDTLLSVWPLRLGDVAWRFGAVGMFSRALLIPLLGVVIAFGLAAALGHRRTLRTLAVLAGGVALVLLIVNVFFLLDAVQMRGGIRAESRSAFDVATLMAIGKYGALALVGSALAIQGWRQSRPTGRVAETRAAVRTPPQRLVVRAPAAAGADASPGPGVAR